ncbi:MAG: tetratricopeptide repeat protein [Candidatus Brocadiae bacterium]|nr:tetratricopeptide repeat protein [Candidatus Brocadiia bacterium]
MAIRAEALVNKGYSCLEKGDYGDAVKFLKQVVELSPNNPEYYAYLGEACFFNKEYEQAQDAFDKRERLILQNSFLNSDVQGYRGCILLEQGDIEKAEALLKEAVEKKVQSPQIYYSLAMLFLRKKNFQEAKKVLKKIESMDPFFYYRKIKDLLNQIGLALS